MKDLVKRILRCVGVEICRVPRGARYRPREVPQFKDRILVEMIGPSGVGKTSLYNAVKNDLRSEWSLQEELYFRFPVLDVRADSTDRFYSRLLLDKAQSLCRMDYEFHQQTKMLSYYTLIAQSDYCLLRTAPVHAFLEDWVCHNFGAELIEHFKSNEADAPFFFADRAFIHVVGSVDFIVGNLRNRNEADPHCANNWIRRVGTDRIEAQVAHALRHVAEFAVIAQSHGARVLTVDAAARGRASAITAFLKDVLAQRFVRTQEIR